MPRGVSSNEGERDRSMHPAGDQKPAVMAWKPRVSELAPVTRSGVAGTAIYPATRRVLPGQGGSRARK